MPRRAAAAAAPRLGDPHARIHIAAVGFEVERVTVPVIEERADRVYLISRSGEDAAAPFVDEVVRRLRKAPMPVDIRVERTQIWDVFGALGLLRRIFEAEQRTDRNAPGVVPIRVNVSTGTKITAIAGTLACMLWRGEAYYVQVGHTWYSDRAPRVKPINDQVRSVEPVSVYELRSPSPELVELLSALQRRGGALRKRELIRELRLDRAGPDGRTPTPQAQHSRLRTLLAPLERRWGFVASDPTGGRGRVRLTDQGRLAVRLFGEEPSD